MKKGKVIRQAGSLALVGMMLAGTLSASADEGDFRIPFEVQAPQNVSLSSEEHGSDSPTTHGISFSMDNGLNDFLIKLDEAAFNGTAEEYLAQYGMSEFIVTVQIDWALDDVNDPVSGWHYNKYWDYDPYYGFGRDDEGRPRCSEWDCVEFGLNSNDSIQNYWIFRGVPNDDRWNGNPETGIPGVKDQLNPDQYRYDESEETLYIDEAEHTFYVRARYVFWGTKLDEGDRELFAYSDWSEVASCGKDAEKSGPITAEDIPAPDITDLRMTDEEFNGNPVVAYTLTVPDELAKLATAAASQNCGIYIDTEARVKGDSEWTDMGNTDRTIKTGEMKCALLTLMSDEHPTIDKNTQIELRCRYRCTQPGLDDVYSGYSKVITFATEEIKPGENVTVPEATEKPSEEAVADKPAKDECPICHFCPQPLGLCIFIWIAIILVVLVVIFIIVKATKKKDDKK